MKLYIIFIAILAISLAEEVKNEEDTTKDLDSVASLELLRTGGDTQESLKTAATSYTSSKKRQKFYNSGNWQNNPENSYAQNNYPQNNPQNSYPQNNYPQNNYPQNNYPQNNYPQNNYPQTNYPQNNYPQNNYPQNDNYNKYPQNNYPNKYPQNDYYPSSTSTTTQVPVIANDYIIGDYGSYNFKYELGDGTNVNEEGYILNPNTDNEIPVKQGWYSFKANDGVVYTVKWWADASGFHAEGAHLPTPPPIPKAIQAGLDQIAAAEKNKPKPVPDTSENFPTQKPTYYPTEKPTYQPTYATQKPIYYPTQKPTYYPAENPSYYPTSPPNYNQQNPGYYPQQGYNQQQNNPQQSYYPQTGQSYNQAQ